MPRPQAQALEPAVRAAAALLSPSSGVVDSHALMRALQADLEGAPDSPPASASVFTSKSSPLCQRSCIFMSSGVSSPRCVTKTLSVLRCCSPPLLARAAAGGYVSLNTRLVSGEVLSADSGGGRPRFALTLADAASGGETRVSARALVIAGGLHAQSVAQSIKARGPAFGALHVVALALTAAAASRRASTQQGIPRESIPRRHLARGVYFTLPGCATRPHWVGLAPLIPWRGVASSGGLLVDAAETPPPLGHPVLCPQEGSVPPPGVSAPGRRRVGHPRHTRPGGQLPVRARAPRPRSPLPHTSCCPRLRRRCPGVVVRRPDVEWVPEINYDVDPQRAARAPTFYPLHPAAPTSEEERR